MYFLDEETGEWIDEDEITEAPPHVPTIKGYGTRVVMDKEPGQWTTWSGAEAPPEYVRDIDETINAVDTGRISEPDLSRKIARQEGLPSWSGVRVPPRPSDRELNRFDQITDFLKSADEDFQKDANDYADGVANKTRDGIFGTYPDTVLLTPAQRAQYSSHVESVRQQAFSHRYDQLRAQAQTFALKQLEVEEEQKRFRRNLEEKRYEASLRSQTVEQLTERSLKGDKEAQAILDAMQKRQEAIAVAGQARKDAGLDIPALAKAVADGQDAPIAIKGSMGNPLAAKVKSEVLKMYPKFDMNMADANYKWKQSATNQRTVNFAGGALPRLGALDDQLEKLGNADINMINRVMAKVSKEFGKPEYTNYESNRNAIVQEIGTALSGTSQASDLRIKIELENLESAKSPSQIRGAISNLREALIARLDVDLSPLYPIEVVRGEKTLQQFKDEMFARYRGKYGKYGEGVAPTGKVPAVGAVIKGYRFKGGNPADRNSWEAAR